ncbi:dTDP-4-dehydrorhamnose 3,5-epimerase [Ferroplasma acidiphilum]|uniref:dTDP-4-dehydrorhamnose 3,5-epimerase n=1 Tax=Ferroplasma acidiphilum TaxID=74969 RepID=UPI0028152CD8|nr:dTDP-4-dehydrorhamnose 3,5-epimerase [Ferroplasma acidiphilum]WMT53761.1 MAG: dTDP-4-dehydrorhamnose 3,5-epimerase [Ferroplasma acidiphilum]
MLFNVNEDCNIKDVKIINEKKFEDNRGFFEEIYRNEIFNGFNINYRFPQINLSFSKRNVFRGFHFQLNPVPKGKLVTVIFGKIIDYGVDLRKNSKSFKDNVAYEITNGKMIYIPEGFAHRFLTLEDSYILYFTTNEFNLKLDSGIRYDDEALNIKLPDNIIISEKDKELKYLKELNIDF